MMNYNGPVEAKVAKAVFGPGSLMEIGEEVINYPGVPKPPHDGQKYKVFKNAPQTLVDLFALPKFRGMNDKEFLVYEKDRYTFQQAMNRAGELGHALIHELGVQRGDRVTICSRNCPEYILAFIAITSIGAVAVPMNSWWMGEELEYGLDNSDSTVVFCDKERLARIKPVMHNLKKLKKLVLLGASDFNPRAEGFTNVVHYQELVSLGKGKSMPSLPDDFSKDENAILMYTSGTTSHPKGCCCTHRQVTHALNGAVANAMFQKGVQAAKGIKDKSADDSGLQPAIMLVVPLFHATGLHAIFLASLIIGRKIVMLYKWDPLEALKVVEKEKITGFTGVPTMVLELMQHPDFDKYDTSSLASVGGGGAPPPPSLVKDVGKKFKKAAPSNGYGMTETNAIVCINTAKTYIDRPKSCGRPVPGVEVEIWDEKGKKVPTGQPGRIMLRGANIIRCYWKKPEATAEAITKSGFLESGDIGKLDEEGYLYILDREKDMIIRGGENISCSEVEAAVYENEHVSEAAVFAVEHPTLLEEVAVAIYPKPGCTEKISLESIRKTTEPHLAKFKRPAHVFIWPEQLPRGATGKIQKREIRRMVKDKEVLPVTPQLSKL